MSGRRRVAVIGGGPAGLMAAETLVRGGASVTVYDRMPTLGRKLLMAGRGGLNLTHSEEAGAFLDRYRTGGDALRPVLSRFTPVDLRAWCADLGQDTFVGSSGRVFPVAMKASPLLRAWLRRLAGQGVAFAPRHRWIGWSPTDALQFETPDGAIATAPDATVLALGGASWPTLGSDGHWIALMPPDSVALLRPANCGVTVAWSPMFRERFEGAPLKNVALHFGRHVARGDVVVTRDGLEGGPVYALSGDVRDALDAGRPVTVTIDLRPDMAAEALARKVARGDTGQSFATLLRKRLNLSPVAIGLLHEAALAADAPLNARTDVELAALIRAVPVRPTGTAHLARAISTAGGLRFDTLEGLMLQGHPGVFAAGEMLDWEAPTGGYLLQACFATGRAAGQAALRWLDGKAGGA
ncbi:MAG: TIGR03862 family flavoprotein [Gluconacetobacter diazotrophicus]|nr:TIGR03862 family flavoprotein [Gluconacetobacter diazotrophicus]